LKCNNQVSIGSISRLSRVEKQQRNSATSARVWFFRISSHSFFAMSGKGKGKGKGKSEGEGEVNASRGGGGCSSVGRGGGGGAEEPEDERYCYPLPNPDPDIRYDIVSLPEVLVQGVLEHLDALSLAKASLSNKMLHQEGKHVAKQIVAYLRKQHYNSRFVSFPELGEEPPTVAAASSHSTTGAAAAAAAAAGRVDYLEMMQRMTKDEQEVLIMGGYDSSNSYVSATNEVTKMIVNQDGTIRFEASTPMLYPLYRQGSVYHQGEVFLISNASIVSLDSDALTQTQTQLADRLPNNFYNTALAVLGSKLGTKLLAIGSIGVEHHSEHLVRV